MELNAMLMTPFQIRRAFIRKVYAILTVQLLVTIGFISVFLFTPGVKEFSQQNPYLYWVAFGIMLVIAFKITPSSVFL